MAATVYNKHLHELRLCSRCSGNGKQKLGRYELPCSGCMGTGVEVYSLGIRVHDANAARSIVSSYLVQQGRTEPPPRQFRPSAPKRQVQPPPYSPWRDPNNPMNPNNPFGWTHPFSPNNPNWRNNPANPNSLNNPNNPMNPNKPFKR
jgi:hypothetical protein